MGGVSCFEWGRDVMDGVMQWLQKLAPYFHDWVLDNEMYLQDSARRTDALLQSIREIVAQVPWYQGVILVLALFGFAYCFIWAFCHTYCRSLVSWYWGWRMVRNGGVFYMGRYRVTVLYAEDQKPFFKQKDGKVKTVYFKPKPLKKRHPIVYPVKTFWGWKGVKK